MNDYRSLDLDDMMMDDLDFLDDDDDDYDDIEEEDEYSNDHSDDQSGGSMELNDFEKQDYIYMQDESHERYLTRVFKSVMQERELHLKQSDDILFDVSQIEGVSHGQDKTM